MGRADGRMTVKEEEIKRREIHFGRNLEKVPQGRKSSGENHD